MKHYGNYYMTIAPSKARRLLNRDSGIVLIDVRTPAEYASGHIPGSINIPLQVFECGMMNLPISLNTPIIVYCKKGIRAASAASMLVQMGFQKVYTLGGIESWPYEVIV